MLFCHIQKAQTKKLNRIVCCSAKMVPQYMLVRKESM